MLTEWKQSGKNVAEFCREVNISYHTFHYWRKKELSGSSKQPSGFIELIPDQSVPTERKYHEVVFRDGKKIIF